MSETEHQETTKQGRGRYAIRIICCIAAALLFFVAGWYAHLLSLGENMRSLLWAIDTANKNYYKDIDEDALFSDIFSAFSFDKYSTYYTAEEYAAILSANEGNGTGIGVTLASEAGAVRLMRVAGNSPAEHAGLMDGMYIHRFGADEVALEAAGTDAFTSFIQTRTENDPICIEAGFDREGADAQIYTFSKGSGYATLECLYRDCEVSLRFDRGHGYAETETLHGPIADLPADTAYIRIDAFYGYAAKEIEACLSYMKAHGRTHLILDLRSNGGGYLSVFQEISAFFMKDATGKQPLAATAKFKSGKVTSYYAPSNRYGEFFTASSKVYILANERTASASECLIGALVSYGTTAYSEIFLREQDGIAKSYGKGIMQSHYQDGAGNVLKLTSAEIFWPNGTSIHDVGVTKADGAIGIPAPLIHVKVDGFLAEVVRRIS